MPCTRTSCGRLQDQPAHPSLGRQSKLGFNGRLVDRGPYFGDPPRGEMVEDVFKEADTSAVDGEVHEHPSWRAVEMEPAGDVRGLGDQQRNIEGEIRDVLEVLLEHGAVAGETKIAPVVDHLVIDELREAGPVLRVQAGDIGAVGGGEVGHGHG